MNLDDKKADLYLDVLDYVLEAQLNGFRPTTLDVAKHFNLSIEESDKLYDELKEMGEF